MPNVSGHTELVGLMAYPIRHTQSPTTHNLAYDKLGCDVIQLAFEVDNDTLKDSVQAIRSLKMLGSNISMPNKTVVHQYLDEVDPAAQLCGAINTVVNTRNEKGEVTGHLKGYNTDGAGYWQAIKEEGIDIKGMKMVLIGTGGAATAIAAVGALSGLAELHIFNIKDKFYGRGEEMAAKINKDTDCKATMNDLGDKDLLKKLMQEADIFCDATGVGMHPLEDLSNIPDTSFFRPDLIVTDTVYAPRETVMMKQAREAGCTKVYNGLGMMLFQALIAIEKYTLKPITPELIAYMKEQLGI
jgi:shikimate dehydrogenase